MRLLSAAAAVACIVLLAPEAQAKKPEDVFGGKILLSDKSFPTSAKSVGAYISALKKQSKDRFWEDKEKKEWHVYFTAFFKKPLNDLEVTLKLYDISDGSRRLVESYEMYLGERGQRAFSGNVKLRKTDDGTAYNANSRIMMVMENRGSTVAQAIFSIGGEGKKYSGKVEFSEDEANGQDSSNDDAAKKDQK